MDDWMDGLSAAGLSAAARARARIPCSTVHTRTAVVRSTAVLLVLDLVLVPVSTARTMQKSAYL